MSHPQLQSSVFFAPVNSSSSKRLFICQLAHRIFFEKKSLLIAAPGEEAARYVDQLLWASPPESFLPHIYTSESSNEQIVITTTGLNLNRAAVLLNLTPSLFPAIKEFSEIYELRDETTEEKASQVKLKIDQYRSQGFLIK